MGRNLITQADSIIQSASEEIKLSDPNAVLETDIAIATPPTPPPTPPKAVTLAEKLNMEEIQPGESVEGFLNKVRDQLEVPLESLVTAAESSKQQQDVADLQLEPNVRKLPVLLELVEQPSTSQIINAKFFEVIQNKIIGLE